MKEISHPIRPIIVEIKEDPIRNIKSFSVGDLHRVTFVSLLKEGEEKITGFETIRRINESGFISLDYSFFKFLWANQSLIPESWKRLEDGSPQYTFFDGKVSENPKGLKSTICLYWLDSYIGLSRWSYCEYPLKSNRRADAQSAVLPAEKL